MTNDSTSARDNAREAEIIKAKQLYWDKSTTLGGLDAALNYVWQAALTSRSQMGEDEAVEVMALALWNETHEDAVDMNGNQCRIAARTTYRALNHKETGNE